ncbi:MAG: hypothetical protein ABDH63_05495 [Candidatus Caldarchaeales archaeon]
MDERLERAVVKFVQTLFSGRYSDAERMIESLERRAKSDSEHKVAKVLRGIHLSYTTDDAASLVYRAFNAEDPKSELEECLKSMREANGTLEGASEVLEVWEAILRNFDRLPGPDRYKRRAEAGSS